MQMLGQRLVYVAVVPAFMFVLGQIMGLLNAQYTAVKLSDGLDAALWMVLVWVGIIWAGHLLLALLMVLRARDAGRSVWWAAPVIVPFVGALWAWIGMFWPKAPH